MTLALPRLDRTTAEERGLTIADFLVPIRVGERVNARVRDLALVVAGALLIYLTARVVFPVPGSPVPITGQTFGVLLVGGALGFRRGSDRRRPVRPARRGRPAVLRRGQGRAVGHLGRDRRLSRRVRRGRRPGRAAGRARLGSTARRRARCDAARQRGDLRRRPALAQGRHGPVGRGHGRQRPDAVPLRRRAEARCSPRCSSRRRGGSWGAAPTTGRSHPPDGPGRRCRLRSVAHAPRGALARSSLGALA